MRSHLNIAVLGAAGYTGGEVLRLLATHPQTHVALLTSRSKAGETVADIHPHLAGADWPNISSPDEADFTGIDCVFCCLPHAASQKTVAALPDHVRVIDLSADFRLRDPTTYQDWYGCPHTEEHLLKQAVYGLSEWAHAALPTARLVANPGCYPTAALLPLLPLVSAGLVAEGAIVINAISGVSGGGRQAKEALLLGEIGESVRAYSVTGHRHIAEIEQELPTLSSPVTFIPHLAPMTRGILASISIPTTSDADNLRTALATTYSTAPFVHVLPQGHIPATKDVRGSNLCHIAVCNDRVAGRAIIVSAIDNLVKGAAGQAVQNMNLMFGVPETCGLPVTALHP